VRHDGQDTGGEVDTVVRDMLGGDMPPEVRERLRARLDGFRRQLPYRGPGRSSLPRLALRTAGALALAVVLVAGWARLTGEGPEPTWAEVAERFASVRFLSTTIYVRTSASADLVPLELWLGEGGRFRMLAGHEVFFGQGGRVEARVAFRAPSGNEAAVAEARAMVGGVIEALGREERFSLETLVKALPVQDIVSAPLPNQDARIASDLAVFDMADEGSAAWLRIWALRESRLPVRMLYWDPVRGERVDAVMTYAHEQPADFFEPAAYEAALEHLPAGAPGRAYALLKDAGGRPVTPADL